MYNIYNIYIYCIRVIRILGEEKNEVLKKLFRENG